MARKLDDFSDDAEATRHHRLAEKVLGLRFDRALPVQSERNVLSLSSEETTFAQRLDCRTYFLQSRDYGHDRPKGVFKGSDEEQFACYRKVFQHLDIPDDEIAKEAVFREFGQAAQVDPKTSKIVKVEDPKELRSYVHVSRHIKSIPVWSSHCALGLTEKGEIGFLELHWPVVPEAVMQEAQRLAYKVANGWTAPAMNVARVEAVEAGIVHTPAIGYFFDIHAAILVIYRSLDENIGRKPMYHFDRHGNPVLLRRTAELIHEAPYKARAAAVCL